MSSRDFAERLALESSERRIWSGHRPRSRALPSTLYAHTAPGAPLAAAVVASEAPQPASQAADEDRFALAEAVDAVNAVLDRLEARREQYKEQIAGLKRRDELAAARIARIEERVLTLMTEAATQRANGLKRRFETRTTPAKLEVDDESLIPDEYLRETTTIAPDKTRIKAVLQRAQGKRPTAAELAEAAKIGGCRLTQSTALVRH